MLLARRKQTVANYRFLLAGRHIFQRDRTVRNLVFPENAHEQHHYARIYARRLVAEVLLDSLGQVLEAPTAFANVSGQCGSGRGTGAPLLML